MKKIIVFLVGFLLCGLVLAQMFFTGAIYDAQNQIKINPFFFQPANISKDRVTNIIPASDLSQTEIKEKLIKKFIKELFYVLPDVENATARIEGIDPETYLLNEKKPSWLNYVAMPDVLKMWQEQIAPEIKEMAEQNMLRTAIVKSIQTESTGLLRVNYELRTWQAANDMQTKPYVETKELLMYIGDENVSISTIETQNALIWLENGNDAARVFDGFVVKSLELLGN